MADLTHEELVVYLEAEIRSAARWKLRKSDTGDVGALNGDLSEETILKVAAKIYDHMVSKIDYNETL